MVKILLSDTPMLSQREVFKTESDNYFRRNKEATLKQSQSDVVEYLKSARLPFERVLDVGCCIGQTLHLLKNEFPGIEAHGIEPSGEAVQFGLTQYPNLHLQTGFSDDLGAYQSSYFDLVIASFVFHWVDRVRLLATVSEIDRVIREFGWLIIRDFAPVFPYKALYHHLSDQEVYTYKQPYWEIFRASNLYTIVFEREYVYEPGASFENKNLGKFVVLQKRINMNYPIL